MTDEQVLAEMRSSSALNLARIQFSSWRAKIETMGQQKRPLSPLDMRRMEFAAVRAIASALGAEIPSQEALARRHQE